MWIAQWEQLLFFPYCISSEKVIQPRSLVFSYFTESWVRDKADL